MSIFAGVMAAASSGRQRDLDFCGAYARYDATVHDEASLRRSLRRLLEGVHPDLRDDEGRPVEDEGHPAFLDLAGDRLADAGVPHDTIDWLLRKESRL